MWFRLLPLTDYLKEPTFRDFEIRYRVGLLEINGRCLVLKELAELKAGDGAAYRRLLGGRNRDKVKSCDKDSAIKELRCGRARLLFFVTVHSAERQRNHGAPSQVGHFMSTTTFSPA